MSVMELQIPGKTLPVRRDQLIDRSKFFTWGEALHDLERCPTSSQVTAGIIELAAQLAEVRTHFDRPIIVQSWYRDPYSNRLAGGVSNSEHLGGGACDWHMLGVEMGQVHRWLDKKWKGGLGFYGDWVHTDIGLHGRW